MLPLRQQMIITAVKVHGISKKVNIHIGKRTKD